MSEAFIPQMEPWFDEKEADALKEYMSGGGWVTEFRKTEEFANLIAEYTGAKHCIITNNGTISLSLALLAVGVEAGDDVIVPDLTMIATPNSAKLIGANPVFADVDAETLCLDLEQVKKKVTDRTKAIVHVSFNGRSNNLQEFRSYCDEKGLFLIEDSAQSLGSFNGENHLGTIGHIGSFSFSAPKIISTGQGGALITNDDELADKLKRLKDFGRARGGNDIHDSIGFNFKFTDIQAVIGIEQMKKLDSRVTRKKEIYKLFMEGLADCEQIEMLDVDLEQVTPWFTDVFVEERDEMISFLKEKGIGARMMYPPIHSQKAYAINEDFPVTQKYANRGLWLPSSSKLTDQDIERTCLAVKEFFNR